MSILGPVCRQQQTFPGPVCTSHLGHKATYAVQQIHRYSITSSARASTDGGMVWPIALAVFRLMTSSNLVGCSTGKSAGLAPFKILSAKAAAWRYMSASAAE